MLGRVVFGGHEALDVDHVSEVKSPPAISGLLEPLRLRAYLLTL